MNTPNSNNDFHEPDAPDVRDGGLDQLLDRMPRLKPSLEQRQRAWANLSTELELPAKSGSTSQPGRLLKIVSWAGGVAACIAFALVLTLDGKGQEPGTGNLGAGIDSGSKIDDTSFDQYEEDARVLDEIYAKLRDGEELNSDEEKSYKRAWQRTVDLQGMKRLLVAVQGAGEEIVDLVVRPSSDLDLVLSGQSLAFWNDVVSRVELNDQAFEGLRKPGLRSDKDRASMARRFGPKPGEHQESAEEKREISPELKAFWGEVEQLDFRRKHVFRMASSLLRWSPKEEVREASLQQVESFLNRQTLTTDEKLLIESFAKLRLDDFRQWALIRTALNSSSAHKVRVQTGTNDEMKAKIAASVSRALAHDFSRRSLAGDAEWPEKASEIRHRVLEANSVRMREIASDAWNGLSEEAQAKVRFAAVLGAKFFRMKDDDRQAMEREIIEVGGDLRKTQGIFERVRIKQDEMFERRHKEWKERDGANPEGRGDNRPEGRRGKEPGEGPRSNRPRENRRKPQD